MYIINKCPHLNYDKATHKCDVCNASCPHDGNFVNSVCTKCDYVCPHESFNDEGICTLCGYECLHTSLSKDAYLIKAN